MVFSTHVEVILNDVEKFGRRLSILHTCGGDPKLQSAMMLIQLVFSTHVEVILNQSQVVDENASILHTCGGDPVLLLTFTLKLKYSPHMWR